MSDIFNLRWKLDRPYLEAGKAGDIYCLLTIEPNPAAALNPGPGVPAHLLLLVDVSESMDFLVRHDPHARLVAEGLTEGQASQKVESEVPSRREMACAVVRQLAKQLRPNDRLSLAAFDSRGYALAQAIDPGNAEQLAKALHQLAQVGGGGTRMGEGLASIRSILLEGLDGPRARKLVILTDGEDQAADQALEAARSLARDFHVPMVAFGTGECRVSFLTQIAKTTLAGAFNHIRHEADADQLFHQALASQKNIFATGVVLQLWLSPDLQARELYRTRPEILFVGDLQPGPDHVVTLRLEQMERGKAYEFLFRCGAPARSANQRLRLAKATLTYDLPETNQIRRTQETNLFVEITADPVQAAQRSGDVRKALARAEVQRQVLFLQTKIDALRQQSATDRDRVVIARMLDVLIAKFAEFGDQVMVNHYRSMREEFTQRGTIRLEMLNRSLAASSRAEELIVAMDLDF